MTTQLPAPWRPALQAEIGRPYFTALAEFVAAERRRGPVYPPAAEVFTALELTAPRNVRAVLLGQDPYPTPGQAHGLSFSVRPGVAPPRSLRNIFAELHDDLGYPIPSHGHLEAWARQGVLLLNTVLTVRGGEPNSHRRQGWEQFTDAIIRTVNDGDTAVVFLLWGKPAQSKAALIDTTRHAIVSSAHPSPLSARSGFFGSRPFSKTNAALRQRGAAAIDWRLE